MRGRKPTPTRLKIIRGNPGRRRLDTEPEFKAGMSEKPPWLTGEAAAEWDRVTEQLSHSGLLRTVDRAALCIYCKAWARWVDAEQKVEALGLVVRSPRQGTPQQNPYVRIANAAMAQVIQLTAEFGMTPASRTRLAMGPEGGRKDPLDLFSQRRQAAKHKDLGRPTARKHADGFHKSPPLRLSPLAGRVGQDDEPHTTRGGPK